jgi:metal-responsive CopG/Arc/MetJ family transcriptional regulator
MQYQTLNISLPKKLVTAADLAAVSAYKTRSELIKDLLANYLKQKESWDEIFAYGQKIGKKMGIKSEEDVNRIVKEYRSEK